MTVYEVKTFLVRCDRPDCDSDIDVRVLSHAGVTPQWERQVTEILKSKEWRVRAANTGKPTFLCPKHFEGK